MTLDLYQSIFLTLLLTEILWDFHEEVAFLNLLSAFECLRLIYQSLVTKNDVSLFKLCVLYGYLRWYYYQNLTHNNHYYLNFLILSFFSISKDETIYAKPLRLLFGSVYLLAGISKISDSWLDGWIVQSLLDMYGNHFIRMWCGRKFLVYGGLFLDLFAGGLLILNEFSTGISIDKIIKGLLVLLTIFHAVNFIWLWKSIHVFPLQMIASNLLWARTRKSYLRDLRGSPRLMLCYSIVVFSTAFALRRYFAFTDIFARDESVIDFVKRSNKETEWSTVNHEFSWRMKSVVYDQLSVKIMMSDGTDVSEHFRRYLRLDQICDQVVSLKKGASKEVKMFATIWRRVNGLPYQLYLDPLLDLFTWGGNSMATNIPYPVLSLVKLPGNWKERVYAALLRFGKHFEVKDFALSEGIRVEIPVLETPEIHGILVLYGQLTVQYSDGNADNLIEGVFHRIRANPGFLSSPTASLFVILYQKFPG
jgi:hypothetical protein